MVEAEKQWLTINLSHSSDGVDLTEMWKASEVLGTTEAALEHITGIYLPAAFETCQSFHSPTEKAESVLDEIVLETDFDASCLDTRNEAVGKDVRFCWSYAKSEDRLQAVLSRLKAVEAFASLLENLLFVKLHSLTQITGNRLWPDLQDQLGKKADDHLLFLDADDSRVGRYCRWPKLSKRTNNCSFWRRSSEKPYLWKEH